MSDLISREAICIECMIEKGGKGCWACLVNDAPTVDAVEVDALEAWLYEIAMNNTDNYLCDACEEIISRLDGLRVFARERKEVSE